MAALLPRSSDDNRPVAIRLFSGSQANSADGTPLHARDSDGNDVIWSARLVLATTGLHLSQFRREHRPLSQAVDYADLSIYDEACE